MNSFLRVICIILMIIALVGLIPSSILAIPSMCILLLGYVVSELVRIREEIN